MIDSNNINKHVVLPHWLSMTCFIPIWFQTFHCCWSTWIICPSLWMNAGGAIGSGALKGPLFLLSFLLMLPLPLNFCPFFCSLCLFSWLADGISFPCKSSIRLFFKLVIDYNFGLFDYYWLMHMFWFCFVCCLSHIWPWKRWKTNPKYMNNLSIALSEFVIPLPTLCTPSQSLFLVALCYCKLCERLKRKDKLIILESQFNYKLWCYRTMPCAVFGFFASHYLRLRSIQLVFYFPTFRRKY